jgi:hypothetical protein
MRHPPTHKNKLPEKKTAKHRREVPSVRERFRGTRSKILGVGSGYVTLAASVLTCLALAATAGSTAAAVAGHHPAKNPTAVRQAADRSSRSEQRIAPSDPSTMGEESFNSDGSRRATQVPTAELPGTPPIAPPAPPKKPSPPTPVAGLSQLQMNNAQAIVKAGIALGMPKRAYVIAVATALQESHLLNLASAVLPESFLYPHQGTGSDHDSVGLFQQRPSSGWGTVKNLMKPDYAAKAFYRALALIPGWISMALTYAAQAVQMSAFPEAYAPHESRAQTIVDALT